MVGDVDKRFGKNVAEEIEISEKSKYKAKIYLRLLMSRNQRSVFRLSPYQKVPRISIAYSLSAAVSTIHPILRRPLLAVDRRFRRNRPGNA